MIYAQSQAFDFDIIENISDNLYKISGCSSSCTHSVEENPTDSANMLYHFVYYNVKKRYFTVTFFIHFSFILTNMV